MNYFKSFIAVVLLLNSQIIFAGEVPVDLDPSRLTEVPNAVMLNDRLVAGGTPTARGYGQAAEQGVRTVIDLRNSSENTSREQGYAEAIGVKYVHIPMTLDSFSLEKADQLKAVLKDPATGPALLHCATGQRALALWALYQNKVEGVSAGAALADAKAKGLQKPELISKAEVLMSQQ